MHDKNWLGLQGNHINDATNYTMNILRELENAIFSDAYPESVKQSMIRTSAQLQLCVRGLDLAQNHIICAWECYGDEGN